MTCTGYCRRDTANPIPCRVMGGCGYVWQPACVLCNATLEHGHCCQPCQTGITRTLADIERLAHEAAVTTMPASGRGSGRPTPASRPPLTVDALDPALATVQLIEGDQSSATPILVLLEDWERVIRDDRNMAPYGPVSAQRLEQAGPAADNWWVASNVTLSQVLNFLRAQVEWACTAPDFDLEEFVRQIRLCRRALARWDNTSNRGGWRIPCPTVTDDGECGRVLHVARGEEEVHCKTCDVTRTTKNLLRVAGTEADVWVDIEAAAVLAGVNERTIRNWVKREYVARRGPYVRVMDIRRHAQTLSA